MGAAVREYTIEQELADIEKYVVWMRKNGVRRMASRSGLELELGVQPPEPPPPPAVLSEAEAAEAFKKMKEQQDRLLFASSEGLPDDFSDE